MTTEHPQDTRELWEVARHEHAKFWSENDELHERSSYWQAIASAVVAAHEARRPAPVTEDFCGVDQECVASTTHAGTEYRVCKWTCPTCSAACSVLYIDDEWCHGDSFVISHFNGKETISCSRCWLVRPSAKIEKMKPRVFPLDDDESSRPVLDLSKLDRLAFDAPSGMVFRESDGDYLRYSDVEAAIKAGDGK